MSKELSYLSPEGYTIFTSQFLKNKGTCCKSACLHCPFGYTLKKIGLEFSDVGEDQSSLLDSIKEESGSEIDWRIFTFDNIKIIKLKGIVCGYLLKNHIVIKHLILKPHFKDQGLSKEMVESYLFI